MFCTTCVTPTDFKVCDFEKDFCKWKTALSNEAEAVWTRHKGSTPTGETGPSTDHTLGDENGVYKCICNLCFSIT